VIMVFSLTIWPWKQNLEQLIAHSTAIIVGTQFWYPHQGGVYLLWYTPLFLLVIFRPHIRRQTAPDFSEKSDSSKNLDDSSYSDKGVRKISLDSGIGKKSDAVRGPVGSRIPHKHN
jgi:hypothetical protein